MKKGIQLLSLMTFFSLIFFTSYITNTKSNILYLHEQTHKNSTQNNFDSLIAKGKVIVIFYADWCPPCKRMKPIIEELACELPADFVVIKVNIDYYRSIFNHYNLETIPAILFFNNGTLVYEQRESTTKQKIQQIINSNY